MNILIYITLVFIFFPVYIRFQGRDALTIGSISILVLFFFFIITSILSAKKKYEFGVLVLILSLIASFSAFSVPSELLGPSIRQLANFLTSICLFFVVVNHYTAIDESTDGYKNKSIENMISFLIVMVSIHIIIGIILYFYPGFGRMLTIFSTRTEEIIQTTYYAEDGIKRLRSIIGEGEQFGELLSVIMPIQFCRIFTFRYKWLQFFLLVLFVSAIVLSGTRSAIVLSILSAMIFTIFSLRMFSIQRFILTFSLIGSLVVILPFIFPQEFFLIFEKVINRFDSVQNSHNLTTALNRAQVWLPAIKEVSNTLGLFGNGMITGLNYHCLYLTLVYKLGIIGTVFFLLIFIKIFIKILKSWKISKWEDENKSTTTAMILSFSVLMINEIKFEFIRHDSHQQIIWLLFALFVAMSNNLIEYKNRINNLK